MHFFILVVFYCALVFSPYAISKKIDLNSNVDLFDSGLAKIDGDDEYDLYTLNHTFSESFLISDSAKNDFHLDQSGLNSIITAGTPNYESFGSSPNFQKGLNIFSPIRKKFVMYCNQCSQKTTGKVTIPVPDSEKDAVKIIHSEKSSYSIKYIEKNGVYASIEFSLEETGVLVFESKYLSIQKFYEVNLSPEEIYLGPNGSHPESSRFTTIARDNHTLAWTDIDGNSSNDFFAGIGGLRANIEKFHPRQILNGQLVVSNSDYTEYRDIYELSGIKKSFCRTYKSEWVDIDTDGDLDLYLGCKNGANLLFIQKGYGTLTFEEKAEPFGLNIHQGSEFKFQDWNGDQKPDLLVIEKNKLILYINSQDSNFKPVKKSKTLGSKLDAVNTSIRVIDLNADNKLDVFVSTDIANYYFNQTDSNNFKQKSLEKLNLPTELNGHLNFADVNLDGLTDICFFEHGIYLQQKNLKFKKSNKLIRLFNNQTTTKFKNFIWFDQDSNGQWDLLKTTTQIPDRKNNRSRKILSTKYKDSAVWDKAELIPNIKSSGNWLQVDLIGDTYNRDAIGAKIILYTHDGNKQIRYNHGTQDSFHSQGHYRQYFGVGNHDSVKLEIIWPDGVSQVIDTVKVNQKLRIKKDKISLSRILSLIEILKYHLFSFSN